MDDLYHYWGNDLQAGATGDLLPVAGATRGQQRILRRLLTNPGDYLWHGDYGAGLPAYIGEVVDTARIAGIVRSQLALEASVSQTPVPEITVAAIASPPGAFSVTIHYTDAETNAAQVLSFNVSQ